MRYSRVWWACAALSCFASFCCVGGCGTTSDDSRAGGSGGQAGAAGIGGAGGVGSGGFSGSGGTAGVGGLTDVCSGVSCDDHDDCTSDGACDPGTGLCVGGGLEPFDAACGPGGSGFCNEAGQCVECNRTTQCPEDNNVCTSAICNDGVCDVVSLGGECDYFGSAGVCEGGACVDADLCDPYPCQDQSYCRTDLCIPETGACVYGSEPDGTICFANGYEGECRSGVCDLCAPVNCTDGNQCTVDGTCNPATGQCDGAANVPIDTPCNQNGGRVCDARGNCVGCNNQLQCNDGNVCTADSCSPTLRRCSNTPVPDGTLCGATASICLGGACTTDALGRSTFSGDRGDLVSGNSYNGIYRVWSGFYQYGLSGFYLNFTGSGVDHELERIMPGFFSIDFSPSTPGNETVLYARYEDGNADDPYTFTIDAQRLPWGSTRHSEYGCVDIGGINRLVGPIPAGTEPVILGFNLDRSADHNVETLEAHVYRSQGNYAYIQVVFRDAGSSDPFCWDMHYALIPSNRIRAYGHLLETTDRRGSHTRSITATWPVLQGFKLWFRNGDHHVDQVGVRVLPGEVRVWMNDQNNDDPFRWEAWWLDLQ